MKKLIIWSRGICWNGYLSSWNKFHQCCNEVPNITSTSQCREPKILKFKVWYFNLLIEAWDYIYWSLKLTFLFSNQYVFQFNFRYLWIEAWDCLDCWVVVLNYFSTEIFLLVSTEDGSWQDSCFQFSIFILEGMIRINDSFKFVIWHYIIGVEDYYVAKLRCILSSIILLHHLKFK